MSVLQAQTGQRVWRCLLLLSLCVPVAGASLREPPMTAAELAALLGGGQFDVCRLHPAPVPDKE